MMSSRKSIGNPIRNTANSLFYWPIVAFIFFVPLFFASHRPFFWALWAAFSALLLIWYQFLLINKKVKYAPIDWTLTASFVLYVAFLVMNILQVLPIGSYVGGFSFEAHNQYMIMSETLSITPGNSLLGLLRWITYGILFFITLQITYRNPARARALLRSIILIVTFYAFYSVLALYQFDDTILTLKKWAYLGFTTGPFVNRNSFATFLGLGAVISLCFLFEKKENSEGGMSINLFIQEISLGRKPIIFICFLVIIFALTLTGSRMGVFATLLALFFIAALQMSIKRFFALVVVGSIILFLVLLTSGSDTGLLDRTLFVERAFETRLDLYKDVVNMILARPWLGYGMGSFEYAYPLVHDDNVNVFAIWDLSHSTYLGNWADMGLIAGTIPMLIFLLLGIAMVMARFLNLNSVELNSALGCIILVAIHSIVDFSLEIHAVAIYTVLVLAIGYAGVIKTKKRHDELINTEARSG